MNAIQRFVNRAYSLVTGRHITSANFGFGTFSGVPGLSAFSYYPYTVAGELRFIQRLYNLDGLTKELVNNVVDFSVGSGLNIEFDSPYVQAKWDEWRWNTLADTHRPLDLQRLLAISIIRDGDAFIRKTQDKGGARIEVIPAEHINGTSTEYDHNGVMLNPNTLEVESYQYNPFYAGKRPAIGEKAGTLIPANQIIHVFDTQHAGYARGKSWLSNSVEPLYDLAILEKTLVRSSTQRIKNPGYWKGLDTTANKIAAEIEAGQDFANQETKDAANKFAEHQISSKLSAEDATPFFLDGDVSQEPYPHIQVDSFPLAYKSLLQKAARGMGISVYALTADFGTVGFLAARNANSADQRLYLRMQSILEAAMREVIEWWLVSLLSDPMARNESTEYTINPQSFPYIDPYKDSAAVAKLVEIGVTSPQQIIRERGGNVEKIKKDLQEWAEFKAGLPKDESGEVQNALRNENILSMDLDELREEIMESR